MKRFYNTVAVARTESEFAVTLDGKPIRTPGKGALLLPTEALARAIAAEWADQAQSILPASMPLMKLASTALDHVAAKRRDVAAEVARYAESDLLCYRATEPSDLVERQHQAWQPLLDWAADRLEAPLRVARGVIPIVQPPASLARLAGWVNDLDAFALTGVADLTASCGSLILALAVFMGRIDGIEASQISLVDDLFQIERWGEDAEAMQRLDRVRADIAAATRFLDLLRATRPLN